MAEPAVTVKGVEATVPAGSVIVMIDGPAIAPQQGTVMLAANVPLMLDMIGNVSVGVNTVCPLLNVTVSGRYPQSRFPSPAP